MPATFRSCDEEDDISQKGLFLRRYELLLWHELTPALVSSLWECHAMEVGASLGMSAQKVLRRFCAIDTLRNLPKTFAVVRRWWHLDMQRVIAIDSALAGTPDIHTYDEAIAEYLTPKVENEDVPSAGQIRKFIKGLHQPKEESKPKRQKFWTYNVGVGETAVGFITSDATAWLLKKNLEFRAEEEGVAMEDVLLKLLMGGESKITLNVFEDERGEIRTADGKHFSHIEATWIREAAANRVLRSDESTSAYRFSDRMRATVAGRDGHCRYPGCTVPYYGCDIDHVLEYDRLGPTSPLNGQLLCRRHHNLKTEKKVSCSIDENGVVTWQIGKVEVRTVPEGAFTKPRGP